MQMYICIFFVYCKSSAFITGIYSAFIVMFKKFQQKNYIFRFPYAEKFIVAKQI